jgi:hypothetical protein
MDQLNHVTLQLTTDSNVGRYHGRYWPNSTDPTTSSEVSTARPRRPVPVKAVGASTSARKGGTKPALHRYYLSSFFFLS